MGSPIRPRVRAAAIAAALVIAGVAGAATLAGAPSGGATSATRLLGAASREDLLAGYATALRDRDEVAFFRLFRPTERERLLVDALRGAATSSCAYRGPLDPARLARERSVAAAVAEFGLRFPGRGDRAALKALEQRLDAGLPNAAGRSELFADLRQLCRWDELAGAGASDPAMAAQWANIAVEPKSPPGDRGVAILSMGGEPCQAIGWVREGERWFLETLPAGAFATGGTLSALTPADQLVELCAAAEATADPRGRSDAEAGFRERGEAAVACAGDPRPAVRRAAATALGFGEAEGDDSALAALVGDPVEGVREAAAEALWRRPRSQGSPAVVAALVEALVSEAGVPVRRAAARALGTQQDPAALSALCAALSGHAAGEVRADAAAALDRLKDPAAAPHLVRALRGDAWWPVRSAAAKALGSLADPAAAPDLRRAAVVDPSWVVRRDAAHAIGRLHGADAIVTSREIAENDPDARVRAAAVAALGELGDPAAIPAVLAATHDRSDRVRDQATRALPRAAAHADPGSLPAAAAAALRDTAAPPRQGQGGSSCSARHAALEALASTEDPGAVSAARAVLERPCCSDAAPLAARLLARLGTRAACDALTRAARAEAPLTRAAAISAACAPDFRARFARQAFLPLSAEAKQQATTAQALLPLVVDALADPSPRVRDEAAWALVTIGRSLGSNGERRWWIVARVYAPASAGVLGLWVVWFGLLTWRPARRPRRRLGKAVHLVGGAAPPALLALGLLYTVWFRSPGLWTQYFLPETVGPLELPGWAAAALTALAAAALGSAAAYGRKPGPVDLGRWGA